MAPSNFPKCLNNPFLIRANTWDWCSACEWLMKKSGETKPGIRPLRSTSGWFRRPGYIGDRREERRGTILCWVKRQEKGNPEIINLSNRDMSWDSDLASSGDPTYTFKIIQIKKKFAIFFKFTFLTDKNGLIFFLI